MEPIIPVEDQFSSGGHKVGVEAWSGVLLDGLTTQLRSQTTCTQVFVNDTAGGDATAARCSSTPKPSPDDMSVQAQAKQTSCSPAPDLHLHPRSSASPSCAVVDKT
ncbi:hypothetical protein EVAR_63802_1 [Eumeta japonica]|uniref:Uncharacterized protein n=1 Tax=Eumeta variegata TaxID=151549 RepID=A0A4C1ZRG7_EUMVA|nr:hypothetical protein EVAR_63802_1 [Eumeta japonica]